MPMPGRRLGRSGLRRKFAVDQGWDVPDTKPPIGGSTAPLGERGTGQSMAFMAKLYILAIF
jgi:hypothetical protein